MIQCLFSPKESGDFTEIVPFSEVSTPLTALRASFLRESVKEDATFLAEQIREISRKKSSDFEVVFDPKNVSKRFESFRSFDSTKKLSELWSRLTCKSVKAGAKVAFLAEVIGKFHGKFRLFTRIVPFQRFLHLC